MTLSSDPFNLQHLSIAERILLVEQIWDSIAAESAALPVTPAQQEELDRRLEAFQNTPGEGDRWDRVKSRIQANNM